MLLLPDPGANEGPPGIVGDPAEPPFIVIGVLGFDGGPIGDGIPAPEAGLNPPTGTRWNAGSNDVGPLLKLPLGSAEG